MNNINVNDAEELLSAIKSNTIINILSNRIDLSSIIIEDTDNVKIEVKDDRKILVVENIENLTIHGEDMATISQDNFVILFRGCSNVELSGLDVYASHDDYESKIIIENCSKIVLDIMIYMLPNNKNILSISNSHDIYIKNKQLEGIIEIENCDSVYHDVSGFRIISPINKGGNVEQRAMGKEPDILERIKVSDYINIQYRKQSDLIIYNESEIYSNNRLPSKPVISPKKDRCTFIAPDEWEAIGDLYLYDFNDNTSNIIIKGYNYSKKERIKKVLWKSEEKLILIIGNAYGTISLGGNIFEYDLSESKLELKYKCNEREEIKEFFIEDGKIICTKVLFDEQYINFETEEIKLDIDSYKEIG